jgi:sulfoxide reductase heme-binding subunit YedZ
MDLSHDIKMKWIKPPLFLLCLLPLGNLTWKAPHDALGANPIEVMTHSTGTFIDATHVPGSVRRYLNWRWSS